MTAERAALAGLWSVPGIGEVTLAQMKNTFSLAEIASLPPSEWLPKALMDRKQRLSLEGPTLLERCEQLLAAAERTGVKVAFAGEPDYPEMLRQVRVHPPVMFYRGVGEVPGKRRVAMVGTRRADNDFRGVSTMLAESIAAQGIGIISGAAWGVDTECHKGAMLANGESWAVLGSSIDQIDPHPKKVVDYLLTRGGTVWSDYPPGVRADKSHFVRRNRLIAWMADVTIMTRGGVKSGATYTVDKALEWFRPVLVVPGEITTDQASGTNALLRWPGVSPCLSVRDVLVALGLDAHEVLQRGRPYNPKVPLTEVAKKALFALGKHQLGFDDWLEAAQPLGAGDLISCLTELELLGRVVEFRSGQFVARI